MGDSSEGFVKHRTETLVPWNEFLTKGVGVGRDYEYHKYTRIFQTLPGNSNSSSGNLKNALARTKQGKEEGLDYLPTPARS